MRALRLPAPNAESLICFASPFQSLSSVRSLLTKTSQKGQAPFFLARRRQLDELVEHRTSQVSGESFLHLCPALGPRSARAGLALSASSMLFPSFRRRKHQQLEFRGSITRPWHSLSTLHDARYRAPCKTRFRLLARLYREGFEPSDFQLMVSAASTVFPITRLVLARRNNPFDFVIATNTSFPASAAPLAGTHSTPRGRSLKRCSAKRKRAMGARLRGHDVNPVG